MGLLPFFQKLASFTKRNELPVGLIPEVKVGALYTLPQGDAADFTELWMVSHDSG